MPELPGQSASLVVRGGHFDFGDGTWFETRYEQFVQPRLGGRYVLFVTRVQPEQVVPELRGEPGVFVQPNPRHLLYAAFELVSGKVQPLFQSSAQGNVAGANRGRDVSAFLDDISALVRRKVP